MNRTILLLTAAAVLIVFSGLEYYLEAQPAEFPAGIGAASRTATLTFTKKALTGIVARGIAGSGTEGGALPAIMHTVAFMGYVFRSANGSSGKRLIAEQRNWSERNSRIPPLLRDAACQLFGPAYNRLRISRECTASFGANKSFGPNWCV